MARVHAALDRYIGIGDAAKLLGVSITTLRRWEASGRLVPERTEGAHRRYNAAKLRPELYRAAKSDARKSVAYARVSSNDQKADLERQKQVLELYCARQGWTFDLISDLGGMNYQKKGLKRLLNEVLYGSRSRKNQKLLDNVKGAVEAS